MADLAKHIGQQLSPAAAHALPDPDQVPRRAAPAGRPDPRARVHHEGRVLLRPDFASLDGYYPQMYQAYFNIFRRCGLDVIAVESDAGMMGGTMAHEFMALTAIGEDTLLICDGCGYSANRQVAPFRKPEPPAGRPPAAGRSAHASCRDHRRPGRFPGHPRERRRPRPSFSSPSGTARRQVQKRAVRLRRGARRHGAERDQAHQRHRARRLRPATVEEIRAVGAEPGYGSPIGVDRTQVLLVVDDLIARSPNLVAGANRPDYHLRNVNYGRDYTADLVTDIVAAADGHACPSCGGRCVRCAASRWATSSSWAPSTARPWARPSWTRTARRNPSSWAATASAPAA